MAKLNLADVALPQTTVEIKGEEFLITAFPATYALQFMEKYQEALDSGKPDLATMKEVICKSVTKDGKQITGERFDIIFARGFGKLSKLYQEVIAYNYSDLFQDPDSED